MHKARGFSLIEVFISFLLMSMFSLLFFQHQLHWQQMMHHTAERAKALNESINASEHLLLDEPFLPG